MMLAAISYWVVGLSVGYGLGFGLEMGGVGVWLGLVAGLATAAALLMLRFWNQIIGQLRKTAAKNESYEPEPSSA
jgi:MATE family multidrug resistance protein